ncbi:hypothetical protein BDZ97DRAFT_2008925 [Flammula alnicola]|nr:hypothetical protein BDZ97DRAFT_2008925 [Flammula alnicola]
MNIKKVVDHIGPIIQEHLDKEKQFGPDWQDKSNDLISWLLEVAEGPQRTLHDLAIRILNIHFAAMPTFYTIWQLIPSMLNARARK